MADQRLLDLFDEIGENMKMVATYKEELRLRGFKPQKVPYISKDPEHQPEAFANAEIGLAPPRWKLQSWRKRCPSGWFSEAELERHIDDGTNVKRVIFYLKKSGAIRYSPQANAYRKAFLV